MIKVFFSYSHKDEALRDQLQTHLAMLKRDRMIETWYDRQIVAGASLDASIGSNLESSDVILLLVSSDFLASEYCYSTEMARALEKHARGEAVVVPIILRHCEWKQSPLSKLRATPTDGKPIVEWADPDRAFLNVTEDIRRVISELVHRRGNQREFSTPLVISPTISANAVNIQDEPRSSNLAIRKEFSQKHKDQFFDDGFSYLQRYFQNSLDALQERNDDIDTRLLRMSATRFCATIYRNGNIVSERTYYQGDVLGRGIYVIHGRSESGNSSNGSMEVGHDDQRLYWKPQIWNQFQSQQADKLSNEGMSEAFWGDLIEPLQRRYQ